MVIQTPAKPQPKNGKPISRNKASPLALCSNLPDHIGAQAYAVERLQHDLPAIIQYHTLFHTQSDVIPAVDRLAAMERIEGEPLILLRTAAFFHDIGFVVKCSQHEDVSIQIAAEVLPLFQYTRRQIEVIRSLISTTKLPQSPHNLLDQVMADADLDVLGRPDFLSRNAALRAEMLALGSSMSDAEWYTDQLRFLSSHRYFTKSARSMRDAGKKINITALERLLRQARSS
jgi:uncharacterized protein